MLRRRRDRRRDVDDVRERVASVPVWWHSIDLGAGVITPGRKTDGAADYMERELATLRLPDLRGKRVLDIGAWDGYYAFLAERRGAATVVALDHYVWSIDWARAGDRRPITAQEAQAMPDVWKPDTLPGKAGFDLAREVLDSRVEAVVGDFMTMDLGPLGTFDVVLYLGVLYHMHSPLDALRRVRSVTRELAVIETQATEFPGLADVAVAEFFASDELNNDPTNWWSPNMAAIHGLCRAAGFASIETVVASAIPDTALTTPQRYRAVVHAMV